MSAVDPVTAGRVYARWHRLAASIAALHTLDRHLVIAVIAQESAGDPCAWRPEPGFLKAYRDGIATSLDAVVDAAARKRYLRWWAKDPLILASSFGLAQVLVIVAIEHKVPLAYPSSLCDPTIGLDAGCRKLRACFDRVQGSTTPILAALNRYNGGGNLEYAAEVLAWQDALMAVARTEREDG